MLCGSNLRGWQWSGWSIMASVPEATQAALSTCSNHSDDLERQRLEEERQATEEAEHRRASADAAALAAERARRITAENAAREAEQRVKAKQTTPPTLRGAIALVVSLAQSLIYYNLGIREEITLGEISFLSAPLGIGELALAFNYHPHHT